MQEEEQNHRQGRGAHTQHRILEKAVQIASVEGLEAMSLATLAQATNMSKSGLFAHFRSKEALQVAIIDEAERIFRSVVIEPSETVSGGARLRTLLHNYVDYAACSAFEGGCFFAAAIHEFDGRPGAVRDRLHHFLQRFKSAVTEAVESARAAGDILPDVDAAQVAFWVTGVGLSTNWHAQMGDPQAAKSQGRVAADALLQHLALRS